MFLFGAASDRKDGDPGREETGRKGERKKKEGGEGRAGIGARKGARKGVTSRDIGVSNGSWLATHQKNKVKRTRNQYRPEGQRA